MNRAQLSFGFYLSYIKVLGIPLHELLTNEDAPSKNIEPPNLPVRITKRTEELDIEKFYISKITQAVLDLSEANQPLHTEAMARMVGVAKSTLYRHKRVREQLPSWKSKKADHQRRIAARLFKVDKIYGSFSNNGKKSQNTDIAKIMGSCVGYSPDIREWLQNKRTKTHGNPEIAVLEQLASILKKLINEGRMPTNKAICRELEISSRTLKGYQKVRERLQDVRHSKPTNTTRENELRRRIQEEGEKLASQGRRVSQAEVARRIGLSVSGLKKYPLIKSLLIELKRNSKN